MRTLPGGGFSYSFVGRRNGKYVLSDKPDPTDPPPASTPEKPLPPVNTALDQILTRLNSRAGTHPPMVVEDYLAPKRVTVFGEQYAPPQQVLQALADVYRLRVKTESTGRLRLTRRYVDPPLDIGGLYGALEQALPDPVLRAYNAHPDVRLSPLRVAAVREIRTAAEPKIKAAKDGHVALSTLPEKEKTALATILMLDVLQNLGQSFRGGTPEALTRFDQLRLTGGPYKDKDEGKQKFESDAGLPECGRHRLDPRTRRRQHEL